MRMSGPASPEGLRGWDSRRTRGASACTLSSLLAEGTRGFSRPGPPRVPEGGQALFLVPRPGPSSPSLRPWLSSHGSWLAAREPVTEGPVGCGESYVQPRRDRPRKHRGQLLWGAVVRDTSPGKESPLSTVGRDELYPPPAGRVGATAQRKVLPGLDSPACAVLC